MIIGGMWHWTRNNNISRARILVQVTIYRNLYENTGPGDYRVVVVVVVNDCFTSLFGTKGFKWHCNTIKNVVVNWWDEMMYRWWCEGASDRAWWVIESIFLRSPDKETWVSLCNLMLKLRGISSSSAILGSDSPQSNNSKDMSLQVTPFIPHPRERPNVKQAIAG